MQPLPKLTIANNDSDAPFAPSFFGSGLAPADYSSRNADIERSQILRDIYYICRKVQLISRAPDGADAAARELMLDEWDSSKDLSGLALRNLAVCFGDKSGKLLGLRFIAPDLYHEFCRLNPLMQSTLVTSGPEGLTIFLRTRDYLPLRERFNSLQILSSGDFFPIYNANPVTRVCPVVQAAPVVTINFWDIIWPPSLAFRFRFLKCTQLHGEPVLAHAENARKVLNAHFWAHLFFEQSDIFYEPERGLYLRSEPGSPNVYLEDEGLVRAGLYRLIEDWVGPRLNELPPNICGQAQLDNVMNTLTLVAAKPAKPNLEAVFSEYVSTRLECHRGDSMTFDEIYDGFICYCKERGHRPFPRTDFEQKVSAIIYDAHGCSRSGSITREGKAQSGIRSLRMKVVQKSEAGANGTSGIENT